MGPRVPFLQAYKSFDPLGCPPWAPAPYQVSQGGRFPHPPGASWVLSKVCVLYSLVKSFAVVFQSQKDVI